jgi:4-hydroxy-3-methylbut-2-enyl diphosphate reductase
LSAGRKVHREVERHQRNGRAIILIGHQGHPEIEGTIGRLEAVHLVNSVAEVDALPIDSEAPVAYAIQTTYSEADAAAIVTALRNRFRDLEEPQSSDICYATTNRQRALHEVAKTVDAVIVVGEDFSSNACRLAEVASATCSSVQLAAGPAQVDWSKLPRRGSLAISAAASTPETSVQAVLEALRTRFQLRVTEPAGEPEPARFKPLAVA